MNEKSEGARFAGLVAEGMTRAGLASSQALVAGLGDYCALVSRYRRAAGLTAEKEDKRLVLKLAVEPLLALDLLAPPRGPLLDVGSGAGSPGIPLALADGELEVLMLEPDRRKSVFIAEAIRALGLSRTRVERSTLQEALREAAEKEGAVQGFPVLASRATMAPSRLARLVGRRMPGVQRLLLYLGPGVAKEVEAEGNFVLGASRVVPWQPVNEVVVFARRGREPG